jgi:hypothetical protein
MTKYCSPWKGSICPGYHEMNKKNRRVFFSDKPADVKYFSPSENANEWIDLKDIKAKKKKVWKKKRV